MAVKKEYILVSSLNKAPGSVSDTNFVVHLYKPLTNVIKTDLVSFFGATGGVNAPECLFIQSRELGADISTPDNTRAYWRLANNTTPASTGTLNFFNNRVDTFFDTPHTLQDIDIRLFVPNGAPYTPDSLTNFYCVLVVEVERLVSSSSSC